MKSRINSTSFQNVADAFKRIRQLKSNKQHIHKAKPNKMYLKLVTLVATNVGLEADGALVLTVRCGDVAGSLKSIEKECGVQEKGESIRKKKVLIRSK